MHSDDLRSLSFKHTDVSGAHRDVDAPPFRGGDVMVPWLEDGSSALKPFTGEQAGGQKNDQRQRKLLHPVKEPLK